MSTYEGSEPAQSVTDVIKATLSPPGAASAEGTFRSTEVHTYTLGKDHHFWALQGDQNDDFDLILLMIPDDTADGDHSIVPEDGTGVRAIFVTSQGQGYAESGTVSGLKWGQGKLGVKADFKFKTKVEGKSFDIGSGRLEFTSRAAHQRAVGASGSVSATVEPPVFPNYGSFQASGVSFRASGTGIYALQAWQTIEVPEQEQQGVLLHISTESPETAIRAFFTKNAGLHLAREYSLENVEWNKGARTFKADFKFDFNSAVDKTHTVRHGKVDLSY